MAQHLSGEKTQPNADELTLRNVLEPLRRRAIEMDSTLLQTYGRLQDVSVLDGD